MLLLLLLAQMSPPVPINAIWYQSKDFPRELLKESRPAAVNILLTTAPDGRVIYCSVERFHPDRSVGEYTCDLARDRARFRPATGPDGRPYYGGYRTTVNWMLSPSYFVKLPAQVEVKVNKLPPGITAPAYVSLMFHVAADGTVSSCQSNRATDPAILTEIACDVAAQSYKPTPVRNAEGEPVSSIQNAIAKFTVE